MQYNWLERTELLVKEEGIDKLKNASVLVVGLGKVDVDYEKLDTIIKENIPCGFDVNTKSSYLESNSSQSLIGKIKVFS